jgi:exopolysaccharide biosynthesis polyprenyl glycosylphosphotransferase
MMQTSAGLLESFPAPPPRDTASTAPRGPRTARGAAGAPTLILGAGPLACRVAAAIVRRPGCGCRLIGMLSEVDGVPTAAPPAPILGTLPALRAIAGEHRLARIVVALEERRGRLPVRDLLALRACGVAVEDGLAVYERVTGKLAIESLSPGALAFAPGFHRSRTGAALARALSLVTASLGLLFLAPVLALLALLIRLDSRGPVLFVQDRVGRDGRRFRLIKFRTMRQSDGPTSEWAQDNGDRITPAGRWLRRFRLDELPQLVNVLRGDMNLVGPRPHPASNFGLFDRAVPYYWLRASVRPGLTGWAQVRYGYANGLEEEIEKMRYDLYYIKHRSLLLDLRILLATVRVVLFGRGEGVDRRRAGTERAGGRRAARPAPPRRLPAVPAL